MSDSGSDSDAEPPPPLDDAGYTGQYEPKRRDIPKNDLKTGFFSNPPKVHKTQPTPPNQFDKWDKWAKDEDAKTPRPTYIDMSRQHMMPNEPDMPHDYDRFDGSTLSRT